MSSKILVIGGTGKTGKRVIRRLEQKGINAIAASRTTAVPFDWYRAETWAASLTGMDKVYVTFQPDLAIPQSVSIIDAFVAAAREAGIKKLVLLSGRGEAEAQACERIIMASGMEWTIVRASFFMQNFSEGFWLEGVINGELVVPVFKAKEPFVDAHDIAGVVAEALLDDRHNNQVYELTGPELLSFSEAVGKISKAIGKDIHVVEVSLDEYASILRSYEVPEDQVWLITYLFGELLDGRNESVANDVTAVLHREATSFDAYVAKTVNAWTVAV
jgi:uncharacterized protein YbjT (DUF2867 family)